MWEGGEYCAVTPALQPAQAKSRDLSHPEGPSCYRTSVLFSCLLFLCFKFARFQSSQNILLPVPHFLELSWPPPGLPPLQVLCSTTRRPIVVMATSVERSSVSTLTSQHLCEQEIAFRDITFVPHIALLRCETATLVPFTSGAPHARFPLRFLGGRRFAMLFYGGRYFFQPRAEGGHDPSGSIVLCSTDIWSP